MSLDGQIQDSRADLEHALASGLLAGKLATQAEALLARMQHVPRLSVFGPPESGKSSLMNLLLGSDVIPEDMTLPTMSWRYGEETFAVCTLGDGSVQTVTGLDMSAVSDLRAAMVEVYVPLPALQKLVIMEVVAGHDVTEQQRAMRWATKRTDIAICCTTGAAPEDQQLWSQLPDALLDHSLLVVTKADVLSAAGALNTTLDRARNLGRDLFYDVLSLDTRAALSARGANGQIDTAQLRASGGTALISAVLEEVSAMQRHLADTAEVFLRQVNFDAAPPRAPVAQESALLDKVMVEAADPVEPETRPVSTMAVEAADTSQADAPQSREEMSEDARVIYGQIVEQLTAEGQALFAGKDDEGFTERRVLDIAVDTVTWIADYLSEADVANDPHLGRAHSTALDAADLIQLIRLENDGDRASNAVSLMIQLKQELQAELAA